MARAMLVGVGLLVRGYWMRAASRGWTVSLGLDARATRLSGL